MLDRTASPASKAFSESRPRHLMSLALLLHPADGATVAITSQLSTCTRKMQLHSMHCTRMSIITARRSCATQLC